MFYEEIRKKKHNMFYEEIRSEHINLLIKYSVQQQFHFNGNGFGNKCYRCNESSLYLAFVLSLFAPLLRLVPRDGCVL